MKLNLHSVDFEGNRIEFDVPPEVFKDLVFYQSQVEVDLNQFLTCSPENKEQLNER